MHPWQLVGGSLREHAHIDLARCSGSEVSSKGAASFQGAATCLQVHERTLQGDFLMALLKELVVARRAAGRPLKVRLCHGPSAASALSRTACTVTLCQCSPSQELQALW